MAEATREIITGPGRRPQVIEAAEMTARLGLREIGPYGNDGSQGKYGMGRRPQPPAGVVLESAAVILARSEGCRLNTRSPLPGGSR